MNAGQQTALDFVEGRITAKEFEQNLYSDPAVEEFFKDDSLCWRDTFIKSNPYHFLIQVDYDSPTGALNAQGAITLFLKRKNIPFKQTEVYSDVYDLLLQAYPGWLNIDDDFLKNRVLPEAGIRKGKELKNWLTDRLRQLFRYNKKPPSWIQAPEWPITDNGPMYFLGQIKIKDCELFHDDGAVYVFLDPVSGITRTVIQLY